MDEPNQARDYCILTLFLNCGLRISELVSLNLQDVREEQLRVLGKGNKERMIFLNDACRAALDDWLEERSHQAAADPNALFLSRSHTRVTTAGIHYMVKQRLKKAGLDASLYSSHKLRHTAATLMLQNGVDVRTLQEVLGHENLNTTQIYTHVDNENLRSAARANPLGRVKAEKAQTRFGGRIEDILPAIPSAGQTRTAGGASSSAEAAPDGAAEPLPRRSPDRHPGCGGSGSPETHRC